MGERSLVMPEGMLTCGACAFWSSDDGEHGFCYRDPPTTHYLGGDPDTGFLQTSPDVDADDGCGMGRREG